MLQILIKILEDNGMKNHSSLRITGSQTKTDDVFIPQGLYYSITPHDSVIFLNLVGGTFNMLGFAGITKDEFFIRTPSDSLSYVISDSRSFTDKSMKEIEKAIKKMKKNRRTK